jgi:hypothetical protein
LTVFLPGPLLAQAPTQERRFSARELNYLLLLAREPLQAAVEGREIRAPRENTGFPALDQSHPLVVTLWLDGKILARAFEIREPPALSAGAMVLGARVLDTPDAGRPPTAEELPRVRAAVAVLRELEEVGGDGDIGPGRAAVVLNGFTIAVGLPKDMPAGYRSAELLAGTCELFGLRPSAWLSDKSSLISAQVSEFQDP